MSSPSSSSSSAQFSSYTFSTVPYALIKCCLDRGVSRTGLAMIVIYSTCIQPDGTLYGVPHEKMMEITGMSKDMVARGKRSLTSKGIIVPCEVMRNGAVTRDASYHGHVAQYRIAPDVWAAIPRNSTTRA